MRYKIDNDNCWQCSLVPGVPIAFQLIHLIPEKSGCLCEHHYNQSLQPNPFLAMVPVKE